MTLKLYFMKGPERKISQCILPFMKLKASNYIDQLIYYKYTKKCSVVIFLVKLIILHNFQQSCTS